MGLIRKTRTGKHIPELGAFLTLHCLTSWSRRTRQTAARCSPLVVRQWAFASLHTGIAKAPLCNLY